MDMYNDYDKYAMGSGISSTTLDKFKSSVKNAMISPNIIEERTGNPLQIDVFSKLYTNRILFLGTEIDSDVANIINSQLLHLQMEDKHKPITIYINTPGGSVYDGLSIYDTMNSIECPVYTTCVGLAASMGSVLLAAGEKGHRMALPHSRVMLHQPLSGVRGSAADIAIVNEEIQKLKKELFEILSDCSNKSYAEIEKLADRDCWLTSMEAKQLGLIDEIIKKK